MTEEKRTQVRERFLLWLEVKANDYLIWRHEQERRYNRELNGPCPDCDEGPLFCHCERSAREQDDADAIYDAGREHGYEEAMRDADRY